MPAEIWEPQIRHFAAAHHVVALDPRGHGRSEKPAHGYYPSRRGQDIGELLDRLGGEPAVVVGWSLGVLETLVCWAVEAADGVRQHWPESRVEVVKETPHALFVDQPELFNKVLEDFITTLPEQ